MERNDKETGNRKEYDEQYKWVRNKKGKIWQRLKEREEEEEKEGEEDVDKEEKNMQG